MKPLRWSSMKSARRERARRGQRGQVPWVIQQWPPISPPGLGDQCEHKVHRLYGGGGRRGLDRVRRRGVGPRPDPRRRLFDRLSVHHRRCRAVRQGRHFQDPGRRIDRHRRRLQAVLRRRRRRPPRRVQRLARHQEGRVRGLPEERRQGHRRAEDRLRRHRRSPTPRTAPALTLTQDSLPRARQGDPGRRRQARRQPLQDLEATSTRRFPTRRSKCSARRRPPARATPSSSCHGPGRRKIESLRPRTTTRRTRPRPSRRSGSRSARTAPISTPARTTT